jgi:hypothetical protein
LIIGLLDEEHSSPQRLEYGPRAIVASAIGAIAAGPPRASVGFSLAPFRDISKVIQRFVVAALSAPKYFCPRGARVREARD